MAAVVATVALARRIDPGAALLAGVLAATSAYLAFWTFGGLETTLATAALGATILASAWIAEGARSGTAWALAVGATVGTVLVRPEGGLVLGAALLGGVLVELGQSRRRPGGGVLRTTGPHRQAVAHRSPQPGHERVHQV